MWIAISTLVAIGVFGLVLGIWMLDAKRNDEVEHDIEHLDPLHREP